MTPIGEAFRVTPTGWRIRWNDALATEAYADGWWQQETCGDVMRGIAATEPDRVLIIDGDIHVTAAQLYADARRLAGTMLAQFAPGSVVSFMLPNWHEAATIYIAATLAGMVVHPILPSLRDHDLKFMLADVGSRMIFVPAAFRGHDYSAMLGRVADALETPPQIVVVRGDAGPHIPFASLFDQHQPLASLPAVAPDDVHMVMYTSGTTGRPKGVMHTHNSINALLRQIGRHWLVAPGDRFLVPSPISHIGGSIYAFETPLLLGATAILMESWDPDAAVAIMERERCTHMAGATPFLRHLLEAARKAETRLPDLKLFICGGASVPPALIREAAGYFERAIVSRVYGSTEVPVTTVGVIVRDADHAAETDGRPGIASVKIAIGGEILARGPQMLVGYHHIEDEASAFDEDGYYRTGDQGILVDGDHLRVTGRIKDLIIRNGENISPKEIEDLLLAHPAIAEIAIVGMPHARTGERAVAVIVPRDVAAPDVATLGEFLAGFGVARFKYPEDVALWKALPRNDAGKVLKHDIRKTLIAETESHE